MKNPLGLKLRHLGCSRYLRSLSTFRCLRLLVVALMAIMATQVYAYKVYVDKNGVMRRDDTKQEVSFYGTNYTAPFAHVYRALGQLGVDHKEAVDRDVYHMSRLGFDGFRLHLWDVELSDSIGNLVENQHLDLLDYLIAQLEKRGIKVVLTAQTNFGNGYPERNTDPYGAYTYDYDKCMVHDDPDAIKAQERYVDQLLRHVNPYTGKSYAADQEIIALEVNNEPCHSGTEKEVNAYVRRMAKAIKGTGWNKPILYNVSHNLGVTQAFYDPLIDGTTYQWYPLNLVAGYTRKGNFLPYLDEYNIPFKDTVKGFDKKAKVVYEFDPADNLYSYLYPAIARTFRKEGFQWITQFAYDPIDMAWSNSEYQTHFLNLAYTPRKALSMMIAADVARDIPRGADFGKYPVDTIFGDFMVSARQDLSVLNSESKFLYTNNNDIHPKSINTLEQIAGWGTSPVVKYKGTGAYFLDKISDGLWRLEVMPDVVLTSDPFAKPSLDKRVGEIYYRYHPMTIDLPELGKSFDIKGINEGNTLTERAKNGTFTVYPGVYLLADDKAKMSEVNAQTPFLNMTLGEYVAPKPSDNPKAMVVHTPQTSLEQGNDLVIEAIVASPQEPDSVMVYPGSVSFWRDHNRLYKMEPTAPYTYRAVIPSNELPYPGHPFTYDIVVAQAEDAGNITYPADIKGNPLDWDFTADNGGYSTEIVSKDAPIVLFSASKATGGWSGMDGVEMSTLPTNWGGFRIDLDRQAPLRQDAFKLRLNGKDKGEFSTMMTKYVADILQGRTLSDQAELIVLVDDVQGTMPSEIELAVISADGFTYSKKVPLKEGKLSAKLKDLELTTTYLSPEPYPGFITREFIPDATNSPSLSPNEIEKVQIIIPSTSMDGTMDIIGAYISK